MKKLLGVWYNGKSWCVTYIDATNFYMLSDDQELVSSANLSPDDFNAISALYPQTKLEKIMKKLFSR
jgi:hypothetical protein